MEEPGTGRHPLIGKASIMVTNGAAPSIMPQWALDGHRVDPRALDRRRSFAMEDRRFAIDARGVVVERADGVPAALRPNVFQGVAARAIEDESGTVTVTLELMHADASLSVPLLVANDLDNVAADWRDWSRLFGLPMLMMEADGTVSTLDAAPVPQPRRARGTHRARFLMRRRTGSMGVAMRIEGTEIIARR